LLQSGFTNVKFKSNSFAESEWPKVLRLMEMSSAFEANHNPLASPRPDWTVLWGGLILKERRIRDRLIETAMMVLGVVCLSIL
jgi:hypothetical protein